MKPFYETELQFCDNELKQEILDLALRLSDEIEFIHRPWRDINYDSTPKQIEEKVGIKLAREFKRRRLLLGKHFGTRQTGTHEIRIDQYRLPKNIADKLRDTTHKILGIDKDQIDPIVQIQDDGNCLYPHRGHGRTSSLYCLLMGEGAKTVWYNETEPFEVYDIYKIPDYSKMVVDVETELKYDVWTTFDNYKWHSVHRDKIVEPRINININFATLTYQELWRKLKDVTT